MTAICSVVSLTEKHLTDVENARLTEFERAGLEAYYLHQRRAEQAQIDYKLSVTTQRLEYKSSQVSTESKQLPS
jgi:hypothetical protein